MLPIVIVGLLGVVLLIWILSKDSKKKEVAEPKAPEVSPEVAVKAKAKPVLKKKTPVVEAAPAKPAAKAKPVKKAVAKAAPAKKAGKK